MVPVKTPLIQGLGLGNKTVTGRAYLIKPIDLEPELKYQSQITTNITQEICAFDKAFTKTILEFTQKQQHAESVLQELLEAHLQILKDSTLHRAIQQKIEHEGALAPWAIWTSFNSLITEFEALGGLLATRTSDLRILRDKVLNTLQLGNATEAPSQLANLRSGPGKEARILVANNIGADELLEVDHNALAGLVLETQSTTSHIAMVVQALGIPTILGAQGALNRIPADASVVLCEVKGTVTTADRTPKVPAAPLFQSVASKEKQTPVSHTPGSNATTSRIHLRDGIEIDFYLNVASLKEISILKPELKEQFSGVGLVRTEFLFTNRKTPANIYEQSQHYSQIIQAFPSKRIVFRTLDISSDKPLNYFPLPTTVNPDLNYRGLRLYKLYPEILETQLAALALSQELCEQEIQVLAPMVTTSSEIKDFKEVCQSHGLKTVGAMIEVPAAALNSEFIAQDAGFLTIGTNDLVQYTLATERNNPDLGFLGTHWDPSIARLLALTHKAASQHQIPISICGQSATDFTYLCVLIGLGYRSFSIPAPLLPTLREELRNHTLAQCQEASKQAQSAPDSKTARHLANESVRN